MDLDELKSRYKSAPMAARLGVMALLGLLPAGYIYMEEAEGIEAQLTTAQSELETARQQFEKASREKGDLPKLQEQLAFTEEQLAKAKKKLPDAYRIEEVLQRVATIAKEVGVKFISFRPEQETCKGNEVRYMELPIVTEIEGRFTQLATFMDRIVHLEMSVFIRNVHIGLASREERGAAGGGGGGAAPAEGEMDEFEAQKKARQDLRTNGKLELTIFRAATEADSELCADGGGGGGEVPRPRPAAPAPGAAAAAAAAAAAGE